MSSSLSRLKYTEIYIKKRMIFNDYDGRNEYCFFKSIEPHIRFNKAVTLFFGENIYI